MWSAYLATVTFMDEQVGRILKALRELELDRETAVFFTSDHGYLLGEHNFWQKSNLREEVTRVPLIIKSPSHQPGRSRSIVELVDLFPTACELTGLKIPASVQGKSLTPILRNPKREIKKSALSFVRGGTSMRTAQWSYMKYKDGGEELYDMKKDPKQFKNLENIQAFATERNRMRKQISQKMSALRN
jgi:arylsulfatase A-like enzyme